MKKIFFVLLFASLVGNINASDFSNRKPVKVHTIQLLGKQLTGKVVKSIKVILTTENEKQFLTLEIHTTCGSVIQYYPPTGESVWNMIWAAYNINVAVCGVAPSIMNTPWGTFTFGA